MKSTSAEFQFGMGNQNGRKIIVMPLFIFKTLQQTRRALRILGGFLLLALGIVLLVGPGPGWLVILLGLGLLAVDFVWARRLLDRVKREGARLRNFVFRRSPRAA